MTATPLLPLVEQLTNTFDSTAQTQDMTTIRHLLHTLHRTSVDEKEDSVQELQMQYKTVQSTISDVLALEWDGNHDFTKSILLIFMHYYNMIIAMPDWHSSEHSRTIKKTKIRRYYRKKQATNNNDNNNENHKQQPSSQRSGNAYAKPPQAGPQGPSSAPPPSSASSTLTGSQLQEQETRANRLLDKHDICWLIYCDVVERLIYGAVCHCDDAQHVIWSQIVEGIVFANRKQHLKRSVIMLCRFIICFQPSSIEQLVHRSLFVDIVQCLRAFLIEFVPTNYRRHQSYNDWHTLHDIDSVFHIMSKSPKQSRKKIEKNARSVYFELLSTQMRAYYNDTRVTDTERQHKKRLVAHIGTTWKQVLFSTIPSLRSMCDFHSFDYRTYLHLFGSSATNLDQAGADMDLYVVTPNNLYLSKPGERQLFEQLSHYLQQCLSYPLCVTNIFHCAVPIIKLKDETHAIDVDISFGKQAENKAIVELLNMICGHNDKVRQLIIAVKHWAKRRDLVDARRNRLSSFGFVLCTINFLQLQKVVPMLVKKEGLKTKSSKSKAKKTDSARFLQFGEIELDHTYHDNGHANLGHLLCGFFDFYTQFNYKQHSVSLFKNKMDKHQRRYFDLSGRRLKDNKLTFVVEDPIQSNYNCAKNVRPWSLNLIRIECLRAKLLLKYVYADFQDLCKGPGEINQPCGSRGSKMDKMKMSE